MPSLGSAKQPNIVFIFTDDQRADAVGFSGNPIIKTPNLDQLAQQGVIFDNAFVNTSVCAISRANVLTGQGPSKHGVTDFFKVLDPKALAKTYPARLKNSGYYSGFIGKWGIGHTHENTYSAVNTFDFWAGAAGQLNYWYGEESAFVNQNGHQNYIEDEVSQLDKHQAEKLSIKNPLHLTTQVFPLKVRQFLEQRETDKPFVLSLFYKAPHGPWAGVDPKYRTPYEQQSFPKTKAMDSEQVENKAAFLKDEHTMLGVNTGKQWALNEEARNSALRDYYGLVSGLDASVGEILALLDEFGVAEETVILFTSDNGFLFGEHGMAGKWLMREPSIRVPGFIYDPRLSKELQGKRLTQQVITTDFTATILELAGIEKPSDQDGDSLLPLVRGEDIQWRDEWFYEHPYTHGGKLPYTVGIRGDRYKYTRYSDKTPIVEEFFDLQVDPEELHNLIERQDLKELIDQFRAKTDDILKSQSDWRQKNQVEAGSVHNTHESLWWLWAGLGLTFTVMLFFTYSACKKVRR